MSQKSLLYAITCDWYVIIWFSNAAPCRVAGDSACTIPGETSSILFSGEAKTDSTECSTWVFCVIKASKIEMPIDMPMLRTRVRNDVPSYRSCGASVAKATTFSGTKMKPTPAPWIIVL